MACEHQRLLPLQPQLGPEAAPPRRPRALGAEEVGLAGRLVEADPLRQPGAPLATVPVDGQEEPLAAAVDRQAELEVVALRCTASLSFPNEEAQVDWTNSDNDANRQTRVVARGLLAFRPCSPAGDDTWPATVDFRYQFEPALGDLSFYFVKLFLTRSIGWVALNDCSYCSVEHVQQMPCQRTVIHESCPPVRIPPAYEYPACIGGKSGSATVPELGTSGARCGPLSRSSGGADTSCMS